MDNIIEFKMNQAKTGRGKAALLDSARVLLFTGVRYDRRIEETETHLIYGNGLGETRLMTQEESEIALDLAAY